MRRLGIVIGGGWVRAAVWSRGRVTWAAEHPLEELADLREALGSLVSARPPEALGARVALTHDLCQIRLVPALGRLHGGRLARAAALNARRWFIVGDGPLIVASGRPRGSTAAIVLAADPEVLNVVWSGCAAAGLDVGRVTALGLVLATGRRAGAVTWREGTTALEAHAVRGRLVGLRRRAQSADQETSTALDLPGLSDLDVGVASAAATARWTGSVALVPPARRAEWVERGLRWTRRLAVAGTALWLGAASVLAGRVVGVERWVRAAERELIADVSLASSRATVRAVDDLIADLSRVADQRSTDLGLLARVAAALPESTTLVSVERERGTVVIRGLTPAAARVAVALREAGFADARVEGRAERAMDGPAWVERFVVRFDLRRD